MVIALLSLGNNVFVYEPTLEPSIHTLGSSQISKAWLISNGARSAAYCYKLGPNRVKAKWLCPQKAAAILHACINASLPPWLDFTVSALHILHILPTQCNNLACVLCVLPDT